MRDLALAVAAPALVTLANATVVPVMALTISDHQVTLLDPLTAGMVTAIPIKLAQEALWLAIASRLAHRKFIVLSVAVALSFALQFVAFTPERGDPSGMPWFIDYFLYATPLVAGLALLLLQRAVNRFARPVSAGA